MLSRQSSRTFMTCRQERRPKSWSIWAVQVCNLIFRAQAVIRDSWPAARVKTTKHLFYELSKSLPWCSLGSRPGPSWPAAWWARCPRTWRGRGRGSPAPGPPRCAHAPSWPSPGPLDPPSQRKCTDIECNPKIYSYLLLDSATFYCNVAHPPPYWLIKLYDKYKSMLEFLNSLWWLGAE